MTISGDRKIVKQLDQYPPLLDHVGVALWQAAANWKAEFDRRMIAQGYQIYGQAASNALVWIGPSGIAQSRLAERLGVTKQAAQQFIDTLEQHGLVARHPDPKDSRARRVMLTPAGIGMATRANEVKIAIEADYRDLLGDPLLKAVKTALDRLNASSRCQ